MTSVLLAACGVALIAQPLPLAPGVTTEHDIPAGGTLVFVVEASAGDLVEARVDQLGADVALTFNDSDGLVLASANGVDRPFGSERLMVVAPRQGAYHLIIRNVDAPERQAHVRVRLAPLRAATDVDRRAALAERELQAILSSAWPADPPSPADRRARMSVLDRVAESFASAIDRWGRARALAARSLVAVNGQLWNEAEPSLSEAVALWRTLDDPSSLADALNLQALYLSATGRNVEAAPVATEARAMALAAGDLPLASLAANNLGIIADSLGDAEGAYERFSEALALRAEAGRGMDEGAILLNLARLATNLGALEEARALHERVRAMPAAGKDLPRARISANNYANLLRRLGDLAGARRLHEESLAISRQLQNAAGEAQSYNGLGTVLFDQGRLAEAADYQRQSVTIRRTLVDPVGLASVLQSLARTQSALGQHDDAMALLRESLSIRERIADVRSLPGVWRAISEAERARGRLDDALAAAERSLTLVEALRDGLTAPSLRASFVAREHVNYEASVDLLMSAYGERRDGAFERRAFELSDRARARQLLDALLTSRVDIRAGVSQAALDEERRLQVLVDRASGQLSRQLTRPTNDQSVTAARDALAKVSGELERHQARMLREFPGYAALVRPQPVALETVQRELLDDATVLLEYSVGDTRSWLWVVTRDTFESHELPGRLALETAVRALRAHYEARVPRAGESVASASRRVAVADAAIPEASRALSAILLGPAASRLAGPWRGRRLAIVAGDALDYLPFAALPVPGTGRAVMANHEVVHLPSASALAAVRARTHAHAPRAPRVSIVADPVFELTDPRLGRDRRPTTAARPEHTPLARAVRGLGADTPLDARLTRLTFSRLEASAIARLLPASRVRISTDFAASREAITTEALADADIVHLATHGIVSASQPALTGLVVSLLDARGTARDGFLRLSDIYNLRLNADLVVLSACHTALGAEVRGEGLVGLTRGFMYAGARRVVASLWAVDDSATAELMSRFYRGMLRDGLSAAAALRAAQREVAARPQWAAPYFWAGFVLQGDWQP